MSRTLLLCSALLILPLVLAGSPASAPNDPTLRAALESMVAAFHGHVSFYAHDLVSGKTVAIDADQPVATASVIKLGVLYEAGDQIRAGRVHFEGRGAVRRDA